MCLWVTKMHMHALLMICVLFCGSALANDKPSEGPYQYIVNISDAQIGYIALAIVAAVAVVAGASTSCRSRHRQCRSSISPA